MKSENIEKTTKKGTKIKLMKLDKMTEIYRSGNH